MFIENFENASKKLISRPVYSSVDEGVYEGNLNNLI
jgi:hypothetical protein